MIVVVRLIKSDFTFADVGRHEKFRIAIEKDKQCMFEYSFACESAVTRGFCGHIFFRKHYKNNSMITFLHKNVMKESLLSRYVFQTFDELECM